MKKVIFLLSLTFLISLTIHAQTTDPNKAKVEAGDAKMKAKPKTTPKQKVHNTIHPKKKETSGTKVKGKTGK